MNLRLLTPVLAAVCAAQPVADPAGSWSGAIEIPGMSLGIEVVLKGGAAWTGTIAIPAQNLKDFALSDLRVEGDAVSFRMAGIPGDPQFQGRVQGGAIQGTFQQGGQSFPFHLARGAAALEARPALPAGLSEREVTVGAQPWALPGTLTLPAGKGPWPVLVLVHGSGPHDRDETIGPNAPFRDLAWSLAQRGVAVLRYEKRTKAHPGACAKAEATFTVWDETVLDAAAAAELLRGVKEVDPRRIFILGHSLGGYVLPRIAAKAPFAAGFISLAGSTRPLEDILLEQMTFLGAPEDQIAQVKLAAARVKALEPGKDPGGPLPLGIPAAYWLDLKGYDPAREAQALHQPLLILQGDRDYQVGAADLARWSKALEGRKNVRIRRFAGLNHLFMAGTGPASAADYLKAGHVDDAVVGEIAAWIQGR
jgi:dienelactone hydrolase